MNAYLDKVKKKSPLAAQQLREMMANKMSQKKNHQKDIKFRQTDQLHSQKMTIDYILV